MGDNTVMEDVDEYLSSRRNFIKTGATAAVAGLAGCSGDDTGNSETPTDTGTSTDEPTTEVGDSTTTDEEEPETGAEEGTSTETGQNYEDEDHEYESTIEEDLLNWAEYSWLEFEDPSEQIPTEFSAEDYPVINAAFEETGFYEDDVLTAYIATTFRSPRDDVDTESQHFDIVLITDGRDHGDWNEGEGTGVGHYEQLTEAILEEDEPRLMEFLDEAVNGYSDAAEYLDEEMAELAGN